MSKILVFDNNGHHFREVNESNYDDDLTVGTVFFTKDALNVLEKYYRIIGYTIINHKGERYPIDIRKKDIAMLEGTFNCLVEDIKMALAQYNIQEEPSMIWSTFFLRWQFLCDWNVFENSGSFIRLAALINENRELVRKVIDENVDFIFPADYKELSQMVCGLNKLFGVAFYNKDYYKDTNYLFDSLLNGYHINMTQEEVDTYCYKLCDLVLKRVENDYA